MSKNELLYEQHGQPENPVMSVSTITSLIKEILESTLTRITVEGEISNFRPASSQHWYFTLKDDASSISAVMFRGSQRNVGFVPRNGQQVIVQGSISVYEVRGTYQIICTSMKPAGEGTILALLEARKRRLAAEGLFDQERKRALPVFPTTIAVITSPTGAALRDILQIVSRRNAGYHIRILPALVQGEQAAESLCRAMELANRYHLGDVIIIGRGGGSLEDLLPFSDERVVRAVAASSIPTISAVGHEIDWAICDFAADLRASTPSAAAELVSAPSLELLEKIRRGRDMIIGSIRERLLSGTMLARQFAPEVLYERFRRTIDPLHIRIDYGREELLRSARDRLTGLRHRIELQQEILEAHSPMAILGRGYAVVTDKASGAVLKSAADTGIGTLIQVTFRQNSLDARVEDIEP